MWGHARHMRGRVGPHQTLDAQRSPLSAVAALRGKRAGKEERVTHHAASTTETE